MKISPRSKKFAPPHPHVATLIADILATPLDALVGFLQSIDNWRWARSDLNSWIKVLDRFDSILEDIIRDYDVDRLQVKPFEPKTKDLICGILKFERLLLENSTNRKMYQSYDRLNSLLSCSDSDVLVASLLLLLRPSQQYTGQHGLSQTLQVPTDRLESMAKSWPSLREHGIEMVGLVDDESDQRLERLPQESSEVHFTFYRTGESASEDKPAPSASAAEGSPSKSQPQPNASLPSSSSSAPYTIHLASLAQSSQTAHEVFVDTVKHHDVPDNHKFDLLCRIRTAHALGTGRRHERQNFIVARLLSIAIYAHTHTEQQTQGTMYLFEPDLSNRIAEVLQLERGVPPLVQMAGISALDALVRYRGKGQEVLASVNAGVNHGILMSLFRKTVAEISNPVTNLPNLFVDALLSFVGLVAQYTNSGSTLIIGAGLIPLLIQIISITLPDRVPFVSKSMSIVDHVLYTHPTAFTMFCNNRGVDALTERIEQEVDLAIETHKDDEKARSATSSYGLLQHTRSGILKHILRTLHKMMQSSGTAEGMRGLIDSSLLKSVEKVVLHRGIFGPVIVPITVNIVATFLHNEPTSFSAIQEAKMPETIYNAIELGIEPAMEVIQAFTNVIGALALNQAGQEQLAARPGLIPSLFTIFASERHLRVLQEKENAMLIGTYFDELVRHHPNLKDAVFSSIMSSLDKVISIGRSYIPHEYDESSYGLIRATSPKLEEEEEEGNGVPMEGVQNVAPSTVVGPTMDADEPSAQSEDSTANKVQDNIMICCIEVMSNFLNGFFNQATSLQVPGLCGDFIELGGLNRLTNFLELPCLPYEYSHRQHLDPFIQLIRIISDVSPQKTLEHMSKQVRKTLDVTKPFWERLGEKSRFDALLEIASEEDLVEANALFRDLVTLQMQILLLADVYTAIGFSHNRSAIAFLKNATDNAAMDIIPDLGAVHRAFIWESILFKKALRARGVSSTSGTQTPQEHAHSHTIVSPIVVQSAGLGSSDVPEPTEPNEAGNIGSAKIATSMYGKNAKALGFLASQIPNSLSPVLPAIARMLVHGRRVIDPTQRKDAVDIAETLATVMQSHLTASASNDSLAGFSYDTLMLTFTSLMLYDETASQNPLNTVLLVLFRKQGGVDAIISISRRYKNAIARLTAMSVETRSAEQTQELIHATGGFKVALQLLHTLISYRPVHDSNPLGVAASGSELEQYSNDPFDFLVKMRLSVAPVILETWHADWLVSAPPAISRYTLLSVKDILAAEHEVKPSISSLEMMTNAVMRTTTPPTEDQINQIIDMGFRRGPALRALERTRNNVDLAADYLLGIPEGALDEIPDPPEAAAPAEGAENTTTDSSQQQQQEETTTADEGVPAASSSNAPPAVDHPMEEVKVEEVKAEPTAEDRRKELDGLRDQFRVSFGANALRLADAHPADLIFDVRQLLGGPLVDHREEAVITIIEDIEKFSPAALDVQEVPLSVRCRILALILSTNDRAVLNSAMKKGVDLMATIEALLLSNPIGLDPEQPLPKWLAPLLLSAELLLVAAEDIRTIAVPLPDQDVTEKELLYGPAYTDSRPVLMDVCTRLLKFPSLPRSEGLAVTSMLVQLTRDSTLAKSFVDRGGLVRLLMLMRGPSEFSALQTFQTHLIVILRHLMEDKAIIEAIMRCEIKRWLSSPRNRSQDVNTYTRSNVEMLVRDPSLFLSVTKSICQLTLADTGMPGSISLRPETKDTTEKKPGDEGSSATQAQDVEMHVESEHAVSKEEGSQPTEAIIHCLLDELTKTGKSSDIGSPGKESQPDSPNADGKSQNEESNNFYACMLMSYLAELLLSFDPCKTVFLSYPKKKRISTPGKESGKSKSTALSFILAEFVSYGNLINDLKTSSIRKQRMALSECAMKLVVAICLDNSVHAVSSSDYPTVRKLVVECIIKAFKESSQIESIGDRYGKLQALGELCNRLLAVPFHDGQKTFEESSTQIAKIMLEKSFVSVLTTVVAEIDLKFPNVKNLVSGLLRPLELLTNVAKKMGRSSHQKDRDASANKSETSSDVSSEDIGEDAMDVTEHRDSPNFYRHSALGMYSGEMEDVNYDVDEDMDEDEDIDDEDDVDVDFDEEGSVDTSNTDEDEDDIAIDEDMVVAATDAAEEWHEDEEMDEDDDGEDDDGEDDDDDEDDEDDGDDEIAWQVAGADGVQGADLAGEDDDEDLDEDALDEMEQAADEIEQEVLSDQDLADDAGEFEDVGYDEVDLEGDFEHVRRNGAQRRGFTLGVAGRTRGDDQEGQVFGRRTTIAESMMHPLLIDSNNPTPQQTAGRSVSRRFQRGVVPDNAFTDMLQTIGDLVGDGAAQIMQRLVTAGGSITADIRVQVPPTNGLLVDERSRHLRGGVAAPVRIQAIRTSDTRGQSNSGLLPPSSLQRWSDEASASLQKHAPERAGRASNHISNALLPEAREVARLAKEKAEEERKKKVEEEALAAAQAAEEAKKAEEEEARKKAEAEAAEEARAREAQAQATLVGPQSLPIEQVSSTETPSTEVAQSATTASISNSSVPTGDNDVQMGEVPAAEGESVEGTGNGEGSSAAAPARVTVMIHGNPVDITDTGMDPTFLEALPDDMREEVINQHFREQRSVQAEQPVDSSISADFLEALPPEIRAELLQQERLEQTRRQGHDAQGDVSIGPAEIDAVSFIASLDPQLRQTVLMDQDDGFLQTLPSHMIAEAGTYFETIRHIHGRRENAQTRSEPVQPTRKPPQIRDAVQLLDKAGIASIVRLLFFPQLSRRNVLFKVFVNLCENSKSRTDLFNLLLSILQDGTGDLATVDKNFAQLSFRPAKSGPQTPKATTKHKDMTLTSSTASTVAPDVAPDLVAQRCFDALSYIVETNESSSLFFLTEHELPAGLRRTSSRKGKGKEKQAPQSHYPIVLLLGLLDRQTLLKTPSIVDAVAGLLNTITKPLKLSEKKSQETAQPVPSSTAVNADQAEPAGHAAPTNTTADGAGSSGEQAQQEAKVDSVGAVEEKLLLANPPQIPHHALRLIVNILTVGDCSGKTFANTLSLIQNLSLLPDARDVIAQELKTRAQEFGQNIFADLDKLISALLVHNGRDELPNSLTSKFSPASSDQAKLLRILKTIDYIYTKPTPSGQETTHTDGIKEIYESFRFTPLWNKLGECLAVVESKPEIEHIATILLPLIESLMVVCKNVGLKPSPNRLSMAPGSPRSPLTVEESIDNLFVSFTDDHRKVLNLMVRNNPSLMSGSFALLVQNSRVLDFDNKRNYFTQQLHRRTHTREHFGTIQLNIRRSRMFEDSYHAFLNKSGDQIKYGKLSVRFYQEEGVDAGGVTREWFQVLARQMFNPNYALFEPCAADRQTYQPNRASKINPDHLLYFKFVGRVIGKAIYDGRLMDAHFARSLYRQLLGKPVDYRDVEWVDPEYYNSLCWILENDPTPLELTFIAEVEEFGQHRTIPLKENGASIPVTIENRKEYVQLSARYRLYSSIQEQIEHLLSGFYEIIPKELISIFNEQEVELLISGTPDIDVDEWRAATEYTNYSSSDPVIVWWWRALKSFNRDEKAKVLSFATGTSRVPLGGFVDLQGVQGVQRFSIHRAYGDPDRLPQAHTCFNQIDLPQYSSYEKLRQQLLLAINEGGEGFGFA